MLQKRVSMHLSLRAATLVALLTGLLVSFTQLGRTVAADPASEPDSSGAEDGTGPEPSEDGGAEASEEGTIVGPEAEEDNEEGGPTDEPPPAEGNRLAGQAKAAMCAGCHGMDGNSMNPAWPKLAGQRAVQLRKQLYDFKSGDRSDPMMGGVVAGLEDSDIADLAEWFASQTIQAGTPVSDQLALGEQLFRWGRDEDEVAACGSCHNRRGEGFERGIPGGVPAVGGQHAVYSLNQINAFREGRRTNDWNGVMKAITNKLEPEELEAIAQYMAGLEP